MCPTGSGLFRSFRGSLDRLFGTTDTSSFAFQLTQVVELRSTHPPGLQHFNRADHRGVDGENSFDTNSKAHAADGERRAGLLTSFADHDAFKWLNAFFFAFRFLQPNMHAYGITGAEHGDILASLVLTDLLNYATHMDSPGQTRYGGASATEDA